jgi:exosortase/archaeosortase family protein
MKKTSNQFLDFLIRYGLLIIVAIPNFWLFYLIFTPLTVGVTNFFLNMFYGTVLLENSIKITADLSIEIIEACVAGSAYYLLFILNLSLRKLDLKKRVKMILSSFIALFLVNTLRIIIFSVLAVEKVSWFDFAHKLFWYIGSIVLVILIWFAEVKFFKIKQIPFVEDIKFLYKKRK